jgi:hypothetical protein
VRSAGGSGLRKLCWSGCRAVPALRRGHYHSRTATILAVDGCGAAWVGASDGQAAAPAAASVYSTNDWIERDGAVGRWRLRVREDGKPVGTPELLAMAGIDGGGQLAKASSDFAAWLRSTQGPLGVLYLVDEQRPVDRYISAAGKLWELSDPAATLIQTLEVQSLSDACLGLIVLPTHPLRVAWQQGFDLMVAT